MQQRAAYHTCLKELVHFGLLPSSYAKKIPRSNLHRWKQDDFQRFKGAEINVIANNHKELINTLNEYPKMFTAYGKLVRTMVNITQKTKNFSVVIRDHKQKVVKAINTARKFIPIKEAVKVFGISLGTFHTWTIDTKFTCTKSYFKKCNRVYPNQVTPNEVKAIKKALRSPKTKHLVNKVGSSQGVQRWGHYRINQHGLQG